LARNLGANTFIISTAVDAVYLNFGKENQKPISCAGLPEIKRYMAEGHFMPGSMKPKIEAIIEFLKNGGERAIITSPENLPRAIKGEAGTTIVNC
jgi:carbamate kinase